MILVPHVVRSQDLSRSNERAVDMGTGSVIDLHAMAERAAANTSAPAGASGAPRPAQPTQPSVPTTPATPQGTPNGSGPGPVSIKLDAPQAEQSVGSTFGVNVVLNGAQNIYSVPVQLAYDPKALELVDVNNGNFLGQDGQAIS